MAEGVVSNWKTRCKGPVKYRCGAVIMQMNQKAPPGRFSTQRMDVQCPECHSIAILTLHGDGIVTGEWIEQMRDATPPPR